MVSGRPGRRGTPRRQKVNMNPMNRRKECPDCGRRFHTRSKLSEHYDRMVEAESEAPEGFARVHSTYLLDQE